MGKEIVKKIILAILSIIGAIILFFAGLIIYIFATTKFDNQKLETGLLVTDKNEMVNYENLPEDFVNAIISAEDPNFFSHNGVETSNILSNSIAIFFGGDFKSTIEQKLIAYQDDSQVKNKVGTFITYLKRCYQATELEKFYSKKEIMELYVNNAYLGENIYGIKNASEFYFGKQVSELNLSETALIAGLFKSPNMYNPYKRIEAANNRKNNVLRIMHSNGYITYDVFEDAKKTNVSDLLNGVIHRQATSAKEFVEYISSVKYGKEITVAYKDLKYIATKIDDYLGTYKHAIYYKDEELNFNVDELSEGMFLSEIHLLEDESSKQNSYLLMFYEVPAPLNPKHVVLVFDDNGEVSFSKSFRAASGPIFEERTNELLIYITGSKYPLFQGPVSSPKEFCELLDTYIKDSEQFFYGVYTGDDFKFSERYSYKYEDGKMNLNASEITTIGDLKKTNGCK